MRRRMKCWSYPVNLKKSVQCRAVVQPLQSLSLCRHRSCRQIDWRHRGSREPWRPESALRESAVEVNISKGPADVLNRALNTTANNIQRVDGSARIDQATRASSRKRGNRSVNLKIAAA